MPAVEPRTLTPRARNGSVLGILTSMSSNDESTGAAQRIPLQRRRFGLIVIMPGAGRGPRE